MPFEASELRHVPVRRLTGRALTAVCPKDGAPRGLTAQAVRYLIVHPALLVPCIERIAEPHDCILDAGGSSMNIPCTGHAQLARRAAIGVAAPGCNAIGTR